jgi:NAD(P)-dependent dehydrogenase (short-subunit alcohol dehydrogenase family)
MTPPDLTGKTVVLTSATSGVGPTLARRMAEAGAEVVAVGDIRAPEEGEAMVQDVVAEFGALDILVNGLPPLSDKRAAETGGGPEWDDLALALSGTFYCCQAAGRHMLANGSGVIVNLSLALGQHPVEGFAAESVIAGATVALTRALGIEWAPRGVRVVGVTVGPIDTIPDIFGDAVLRTPLQRRGSPDELGEAVLYLASDDAAYVTAENLSVDGGWSAFQMF